MLPVCISVTEKQNIKLYGTKAIVILKSWSLTNQTLYKKHLKEKDKQNWPKKIIRRLAPTYLKKKEKKKKGQNHALT